MEWHDIEVDGRHTVKFSDFSYVPLTSPPQTPDGEERVSDQKQGGIIRHGEWAWQARGSVLQIISLRNGQTISSYEFCESKGYERCCIKYVEEIFPNNPDMMLLAVILENYSGPANDGSYIALYSVEESSVLNLIELSLHITCARFMESSVCRRTLLQNFDGCLAIGSQEGAVVLLDLNIHKVNTKQLEMQQDTFVPCHIVKYNLPLTEIHRNFRQCQQDGIHFGLQMEVMENACSVQCILPIDIILGIAVGLEDGRLVLYDLTELQIFNVVLPRTEVTLSSIVKMDFLVPPDDPRPCLYIWTLHENDENLHAVLHSLMYEKRLIEEYECGAYFETFQCSSVRLQLPLEATKSVALACEAISTLSSHGEDDSNCLCIISWLSELEGKNKLLIFDLNQWYKEEMPAILEYGRQPNYLAGYIFNGECVGLHTLLKSDSISHFNSMQRFEEHFYPNSLSFECLLLHADGCRRYNWEGVQNRVINLLRSSNSTIFLEPNFYFNEIIRTRLMPQFCELNMNSTFSRNAKCEILLSTALEHNCISLLRDCSKSWVDGSFMGNFAASTGLSLSTITDWIWKRAASIKERCNDLCKCLFEFGGYPLDNREQKELGFITRQLKLLSDLFKEILIYAKKQIPERVFFDLESKYNSLCMASSYQDILLWLFNIGLLPEATPYNNNMNVANDLVPYPYKELKEFYREKRNLFAKLNDSFISKKTGSCKLLYIDSFIEHVCKGNTLYEYWLENDGDGLYPPNSLEAMLRIMLVPDLSFDNKYAILLYFFLDLNISIDEEAYKDVVANFIKFPSVFKLSASLIKTVQAFWNLDHDHYLPAVDEFISPFNKNQSYPQWQVELLIEVLLNKNANNLALRTLESQASLISPFLKLKTLLANELIPEAFHFVRSKNDDLLLETFFSSCLNNGQFGVIRDLAFSEREGLILQNILKNTKAPCAESLHFVYLLQKSKYIEAVSYMDELSSKSKIKKSSLNQISQMETPNLVLSAFNTTMTPVTQGLTDVYFRIKNKIKKKEVDNKSPVPLSCQLIKQNANGLLGGIYHSSALSAHFATYYWGEMEEETKQANHLLSSNNAPFLRRPQIDTNCVDHVEINKMSYPKPYKAADKRTLMVSGLLDIENEEDVEKQQIENKLNPKKKRRLVGQEIVNNLSHFMKMSKTSINLNATGFQWEPECSSKTPVEENQNPLLTRPLLVKQPKSSKDTEEKIRKLPEIHGILKTNTPEFGLEHRESIAEEEKNLRFKLPSIGNMDNTHIGTTFDQEALTKEMDITQEVDLKNVPKFRRIARTVSEESIKSTDSSGSQSDENFYSPVSSQNSSKLDCSNLSKDSFKSGPQARKPLSYLSVERSEKSSFPEEESKTATLEYLSISKSSALGYATAPETSKNKGISPRRSVERVTSEYLDICGGPKVESSKDYSNVAYVTALTTLTTKPEVTQANNCDGDIAFQTTVASSKISEFVPKISSSKVGFTPVKSAVENRQQSPAKLFECTTVEGSLATFECTNRGLKNIFSMPSLPSQEIKSASFLDKPTEDQKRRMLETTLDMSSYDSSMLDSTSLQQSKFSSIITSRNSSVQMKTLENNAKNMEKENIKENPENHTDCKQVHGEGSITNEQTRTNISTYKENPKYDCIVLSSSSSSSSLKNQKDYEDSNESSQSDEEEEDESDGDNENFEFNVDEELSASASENESENETYNRNSLSDNESEEVIQLLEDSSSDMRQEQANNYDESDSDDVKVVEDTDFLAENADKLLENKQISESGEIKSDYASNSNVRDYEEEDDHVHVVEANCSKVEEHSVENFGKFPLEYKNSTSGTDNLINENMETSTTTIITKEIDESKCEDVPTKETYLKDDKHEINKEEENSQIIEFENKSKTIMDNVESENFATICEEKESITLTIGDSMDCSDSKADERLQNKLTQKETSNNAKDKSNSDYEKEIELQEEIVKETPDISTPYKQQLLRGSPTCLKEIETKDLDIFSNRRRTRGISVPPQTIVESEEFSTQTPRMQKSSRASSLQPNYKIDDNSYCSNDVDIENLKKFKKVLEENDSKEKTRSTGGVTDPSAATSRKITTRRRSALLDAINEDVSVLDSPSSRTRLRTRLNSIDSEIESPIISASDHSMPAKRTRRRSVTSNVSESQLTPKRTRRNSSSSQTEVISVLTPRSLRARSVVSVQEEESENIPYSPKPKVNKVIGTKRRKSIAEEQITENKEQSEQFSPKSDNSALSETSYSTTRRLTRTQLAVMEKSAALSHALTQDKMTNESKIISPPPNKRNTKTRYSCLPNSAQDSDDTESVSSKISATSSATATKRRVTRRSVKDKDEVDDEVASVASSVGSGKSQRPRRSKDKSSPKTTLTAIPEDAPLDTKKRGRSTKI